LPERSFEAASYQTHIRNKRTINTNTQKPAKKQAATRKTAKCAEQSARRNETSERATAPPCLPASLLRVLAVGGLPSSDSYHR